MRVNDLEKENKQNTQEINEKLDFHGQKIEEYNKKHEEIEKRIEDQRL